MIGKQLGGVLPAAGRVHATNDKAILAAADAMIGARARAHEDAAAASGAQRGLGGGRRRQPLFRRRGAVGAGQDRSGAAGHGALRHRRGDPAGRDPGAAVHAGVGGEAARPARRAGGRARISTRLGGRHAARARRGAAARRAGVSRATSSRKRPRRRDAPCWSTAIAISIFPTSRTSSTPSSARARGGRHRPHGDDLDARAAACRICWRSPSAFRTSSARSARIRIMPMRNSTSARPIWSR